MSRSVDFICLPVCFGKQEARQQAVQKTHTQALNLLVTLLQIVLNMQKLRQPIKVSNIVFFVDKGLWNELQKMTIKYFYFEVSFLGSFHKTLCYKIRNNSDNQILSFGFPHCNLNFCLKHYFIPMWTISIQLRAVCDCHALLWYALNSKHQHTHKKTALKNPWRSHFCIRGENLPEDDDEQSVERRFYIYGCDSVCPNKKVILHCHHSWRITFCSDSKTNTQSELLHSLDKIETKKEQVIQDELINCALWKIYLCMTLTSNSDVVGS